MSFKIARVLETIKDGEWHTLEEVRRKVKLTRNQIQQVASFLEQYEFTETDKTKRKIRMKETAKSFLTQKATS